MLIADSFKNALKQIKDVNWIENIDSIPNEDIIQKIMDTIDTPPRLQKNFISLTGHTYDIYHILENILAIDDEFLWTKDIWLFYWEWLIDMFWNNISIKLTNDYPEKFTVWAICKTKSLKAMNQMELSSWHKFYGKCFIIKWYDLSEYNKAIYFNTKNTKCVLVEDINWNLELIPQDVLQLTREKDLKKIEWKRLYKYNLEVIKDKSKQNKTIAAANYAAKLKEFMDASANLKLILAEKFEEMAAKMTDMSIMFINEIKKNKQIENITYIENEKIVVDTIPIFSDAGWKPMGRYRMTIMLDSWNIRGMNLDINNNDYDQHPHINARGECCLWDFIDPLRIAWDNKDYVTLIGWLISFLESLYEDSVYISMQDFQNYHKDKFKCSIPTVVKPVKVTRKKDEVATEALSSIDESLEGWSKQMF